MCGAISDLPDSHFIDNTLLSEDQKLIAGGGSADVCKHTPGLFSKKLRILPDVGEYQERRVAIKRFRIYGSEDLEAAYKVRHSTVT
jgi:hypothetical protein